MSNGMKDAWNVVKKEMATSPVTLSPKLSFTYRYLLKGLEMILARYKFAAKMIRGRGYLLDLGCNDGTGDLLLAQECHLDKIVGIDFDEDAIAWAKSNISDERFSFIQGDFFESNLELSQFDYVVTMDVIEHIPTKLEGNFFQLIIDYLKADGFAVIGTPNITMAPYANEFNKKAHINNYDQNRLYNTAKKYFNNVFIFGMTDEVLQVGFDPMCCYIFALCCGKVESGIYGYN